MRKEIVILLATLVLYSVDYFKTPEYYFANFGISNPLYIVSEEVNVTDTPIIKVVKPFRLVD